VSRGRSAIVDFWNCETPALIGFQPIFEQESSHVHRAVFDSDVECVGEDEGYNRFVFHGR
jgi:hypothetical protein